MLAVIAHTESASPAERSWLRARIIATFVLATLLAPLAYGSLGSGLIVVGAAALTVVFAVLFRTALLRYFAASESPLLACCSPSACAWSCRSCSSSPSSFWNSGRLCLRLKRVLRGAALLRSCWLPSRVWVRDATLTHPCDHGRTDHLSHGDRRRCELWPKRPVSTKRAYSVTSRTPTISTCRGS